MIKLYLIAPFSISKYMLLELEKQEQTCPL